VTELALDTLSVCVARGRATIVVDHPPMNLYDAAVDADLERALDALEAEGTVRVVVVESADPEFFVAHYDVTAVLDEDTATLRTTTGGFTRLVRRLHEAPWVSIGKVRGAARGGGCELLLALDLRFGALGRAVLAQPEALLGILAAGGGTQRLPELAGRARALELLTTGLDVDAATAELYGLLNRAVPDGELDALVDSVADRIAAAPAQAVALTKLAVDTGTANSRSGFALEALLLDIAKRDSAVRRRLTRFLASGGQTRTGELDFARLLDQLR
jgi:enoyl-CoA hydratase/carnithine racemase